MNKLKIGALMLARSGSSFKDKNIYKINGYPLMSFGMLAARQIKEINCFYLSSDSSKYLEIGESYGYSPIKRPKNISDSNSKSDDAVLHAFKNNPELRSCEIIIVQHANVVTIYPEIINKAIEILLSDNSLTSVVPSHVNNEYNPYRSFFLKDDKITLSPSINYNSSISPNRQELPDAYFLDHSFWCIRSSNIIKDSNFSPWNSLGDFIYPFKTENMFDIHDKSDIDRSIKWLNENNKKVNYLKWS